MEKYSEYIEDGLRFRIQQVGLTTLNNMDIHPNFAEVYTIDLSASEAKYQKDKVFVDAIFALDKDYSKEKISSFESGFRKTTKKYEGNLDSVLLNHGIMEDKSFDYKQILKLNYRGRDGKLSTEGDIHKFILTSENAKKSFRSFIKYYSVQSLKNIEVREKQKFVLKLDTK